MKRMLLLLLILILFLAPLTVAFASVLDELNRQIQEKQEAMKKMEEQINVYKKDIEAKQNEAVTLSNQLAILKSRVTKTELDIRLTESQIETLDLEIASLNAIIEEKKGVIEKEKIYIANLLRLININDQKDYLNVLLTSPSFSEYFNQTKYLEDLNSQINQSLKKLKAEKADLESKEKIAVAKKEKLVDLKKQLNDRRASLDEQRTAKGYLLAQTKSSESKFRLLLAQLRQEQSSFDQEISTLQRKAEKELVKDNKLDPQATNLSWPADPIKGISVYFHDPTYPFRYLFEHSGLDMPLPTGTPIAAMASGYVAWVRSTNRSYGNSIMIIHNDGIATLYAHLSKFSTTEGKFVKRGEIVGYSGGMPGTPGAGFSTGPHLHFEVRLSGLPVDPMGYLE